MYPIWATKGTYYVCWVKHCPILGKFYPKSQFTVAVLAWTDKGHCRPNCEMHGDKILDECSWKLCNNYSFMHDQCSPWHTGGSVLWKGETKAIYVAPHRCRSDNFKMYKVGPLHVLKICGYIRGHLGHVLTSNWSIKGSTVHIITRQNPRRFFL